VLVVVMQGWTGGISWRGLFWVLVVGTWLRWSVGRIPQSLKRFVLSESLFGRLAK